jgi:hypothetical protein
LILPVAFFIFTQYKLIKKFDKKLLLKNIIQAKLSFLLGFLPVFLSWYGQNLGTYLEFAGRTSMGDVANATSLGPVFSPITVLKFWKVISLWHFGWPLVVLIVGLLVFLIIKNKKSLSKKIFIKPENKLLTALFLIPLPSLILATLNTSKTARYFLPVEIFWIILFAFLINLMWQERSKIIKGAIVLFIILTGYQFLQAFIPGSLKLPQLPQTGLIFSTGKFVEKDPKQAQYDYMVNFFQQEIKANKGEIFYLVPEQIDFNDAELIWYFTQKGEKLNTLGEFSVYTRLDQGIEKIGQSGYVIINSKPDLTADNYFKYSRLVSKIRSGGFLKIAQSQDLGIMIYLKIQ